MDTQNNENEQIAQNPPIVSPDQASMFGDANTAGSGQEDATRMDIPNAGGPTYTLESSPEQSSGTVPTEDLTADVKHDETDVPKSTKIKILAALAIVGVAGYIAYWVQEPVQLKADLLSGTAASSPNLNTTPTDAAAAAAPSTDAATAAAAASAAPTATSKNVDVSLFGFEPAVMKIDKGTTVIWTNTSTEDQTIIGSSEDGQSFTSPVMTSGNTFSFKFDQDASFTYYSTYNPALKATITVGTGGTTAAATTDTTIVTNPAATATTAAAGTSAPATDTLFGSAATTDTSAPAAQASSTNTSLNASATDLTAAPTPSITTPSIADLSGAAPTKLAKTGPAEDLYIVILLGIAWFNRKKLIKVFK